jgi:hypothetical protein
VSPTSWLALMLVALGQAHNASGPTALNDQSNDSQSHSNFMQNIVSRYLAGFLGLIAAALWFLVTLGWRAAVPVAFCYFVTELVPSVIVAAVRSGT